MKKLLLGCLFVFSLMIDSVVAQGVDPSVISQLANSQVPVNGYFAQYDRTDPYGWIYLSSDQSTLVKLEGMDPVSGYLKWTSLNDYFESFGFDGEHIVIGHPKQSQGLGAKHIQGTVIGSGSGQPISGARVMLIDSQNNQIITSVTTDNQGRFDILATNLDPNHTYVLVVSKEGYQHVMGNLNLDLLGSSDENVNYGVVQLIDSGNAIHATVSGLVMDSTTGAPVGNAQIKLYAGENVTASSTPVTQAVSDDRGHFSLANVAAGHYTLVVRKDGYATNYTNLTVDEDREYIEISLSPQLIAGQNFRIQLSWGATPEDLDSHLAFIKNGSLQYHIYFAQKYAYYDESRARYVTYDSQYHSSSLKPVAFLDRDDVNSYGPETVTIYELDNAGVYKYFVHDYSNMHNPSSTAMAYSGARVKIFNEEGMQRVFNVPNEPGTVWKVFEIRGGEIVPCQSDCMFGNYPTNEELATRSLRGDLIMNLLSHLPQK